jgi:lipoprotein-releasing system ATP-binding protein
MSECLIRVKGLHKSFINANIKLEVLRGINLDIRDSEVLALVGASGVGKSTLLHILGALDKPTSGQVYFRNEDLFAWNDKQLAVFRNKTLGFVFQFHHLLPEFSALENVMLPLLIQKASKDIAQVRAKELLAEVGLEQRATHRPGELSGGEQQRVAIARALVNNPQVILADEPTGNLDSKTGEDVYHLLRELNRRKKITLIYVTHNESLARRADRVIRLVDGGIAQA